MYSRYCVYVLCYFSLKVQSDDNNTQMQMGEK